MPVPKPETLFATLPCLTLVIPEHKAIRLYIIRVVPKIRALPVSDRVWDLGFRV